MLLATLLFTTADGAAKYVTAHLAPQQIIGVRYGLILVLLLPVLWLRRRTHPVRTRRPVLHVLRGVLLMISAVTFVFALSHLPLELCTAIGFVSPLYVTALSIPLLGETVGVRRWAAVGAGFAGVLVILRPGASAFEWAMLLPLLSSLSWALGLVITRRMAGSEGALTVLAWSTLVGLLASVPLALPVWRDPGAREWMVLGGLAVCNAAGQYFVIRAFMTASASLLAPFSYSSILWAVLIGAVVFGSLPDAPTLAGTLVLTGAGLYVWHRERVREAPPTVPGAYLAEVADPGRDDA